MKQLGIIVNFLVLLFLSSCATQKQISSNDDVYANPKEDRLEDARIAAEKKAARQARANRYNDSIAAINQAQKAQDDANPYYKDREFKYDDYYDYEYATRIKRFDNNINGLGYYDNYYTNSYWYNQNPYNYGVSVYNGYSWWGSGYNNYSYNPSVSFYMNYGWGNNYGYGGYNGYNPYNPYTSAYWQGYNNGYNHGYNNGWAGYPYNGGFGYGFGYGYGYNPYGYGYNPYGYGYGGGYGYPYNNGWGYYNSYDNNSSYTYGPRASHTGNNSPRTSNPGLKSDDYYQRYVSTVTQQQAANPKFSELPVRTVTPSQGIRNPQLSNPGKTQTGTYTETPVKTTGPTKVPVRDYNNQGSTPVKQTYGSEPVRAYDQPVKSSEPVRVYDNQPVKQPTKQSYESQPVRNEAPVKQYETPKQYQAPQQYEAPVKQYEAPVKQQQYEAPAKQYEAPVRQNNNYQPSSSPSNNGGGGGRNSGGGGGGGRPR